MPLEGAQVHRGRGPDCAVASSPTTCGAEHHVLASLHTCAGCRGGWRRRRRRRRGAAPLASLFHLLASQSSETPCTSGSCWQTNAAPPRSPSPRGSLLLRRQPLLLGMQGLLPQGQPREAGLVAWRPRLRQAQRPGRTAFGALASQCERSHAAGAAAAASAASGPPVPRTHPQAGQAASGCVSC